MSTFLCTVSTNIYQDHVTHLLFRGDPLDHKQHDLISNLDHHYSIKIIEKGWLLRHSYPMRIINCIGNLQSFWEFWLLCYDQAQGSQRERIARSKADSEWVKFRMENKQTNKHREAHVHYWADYYQQELLHCGHSMCYNSL